MSQTTLRDEINKRLTLNWLIQGAAQHAGMTFHHLARDELDALDPRLLRLYDQFALFGLLQYWHLDAIVLFGWPPRFWRRAKSKPSHPFFGHPVLSRHGGTLAAAARRRALERCKEKGIARWPFLFQIQALARIMRLRRLEAPHRPTLVDVAKRTTSTIWGIPIERLDGDISRDFRFGRPLRVGAIRGAILRIGIMGLGGVVRRDHSLVVVSRGTNWQVLTHELVKATAELICMHGLAGLSDETCERVVDAADRLEFEPWMLHTRGELWRHFLAAIPPGRPVAEVLMAVARLPPGPLESLILMVIEHPEGARDFLANLTDEAEPLTEE